MNNRKTYTVTELNMYIKSLIQRDGELAVVFVQGEVTNLKDYKSTSGHMYFSIKDDKSQLPCVMFRGDRARGLDFDLENGMEIIIGGTMDLYERDGKIQLYAKKIKSVGDGAIAEKYEKLKAELEGLGYFDKAHKKELPKYVKTVGIVTAKTGAVIHDIQTTAARRNPYVQLLLYPSAVQGEGAAEEIARGIKRLDREGVDVIIIGRGGGSMEDLWAFNERVVADAIYECETPIVSAVGHETDFSISDFVADLRAATPTAAAELTVFDVRDVLDRLDDYEVSFRRIMDGIIRDERMRVARAAERLNANSPVHKLELAKENIEKHKLRLKNSMRLIFDKNKNEFVNLATRLDAASPIKRLKAGYAYVSDSEGGAVEKASDLAVGDKLTLTFSDGQVVSQVTDVLPVK
ncbi:MAG: exodeoxyribonuclease VII large subunit [Eubacterium sp.]|nr:exodeoxyribonuclease VII large subunit [Eubacterium sp.]